MDSYKLSSGLSPIFHISTVTDFEERTMKRKPFWDSNDGEPVLYAVCPLCDDPIQMIALYRRKSDSPRAYGRHVGHDVPGLAKYDQEAYDCCPYANPDKLLPGKGDRKKKLDGLPLEIYKLLREQFDRVIYLLQKDIDIFISIAFAETLLNDYLKIKGYLYVAASMQNLPWIFAYMSENHGLIGRFIKKDSPLAKAIVDADIPDCVLTEGEKPGFFKVSRVEGRFPDISFCFIAHELTVKEHALSENIDFVVNCGKGTPPRRIYRKTLQVNQSYFLNLINLPEERSQRNIKQLALAADKMPDL